MIRSWLFRRGSWGAFVTWGPQGYGLQLLAPGIGGRLGAVPLLQVRGWRLFWLPAWADHGGTAWPVDAFDQRFPWEPWYELQEGPGC